MGQSTDAYLFYGIDLGSPEDDTANFSWMMDWDNDDDPDNEEQEWDDVYYRRMTGDAPPDTDYDGDKESHRSYWNRKWEWLKAIEVEIAAHCSCDYPMYFVHVKSLFQYASRGEPHALVLHDLEEASLAIGLDDKVKQFCEVMEITFDPARLGWHLASNWC